MNGGPEIVDLLVIGGGINGAGIARDAAGRGLSVILCEKDDLAEGTSSRSGKLVHGGLRYLEYYEFRLVREALIEREVLLRSGAAHHLADALRAAAQPRGAAGLAGPARPLPLRPSRRPQAAARRRARSICAATRKARRSRDEFTRGFEYSDCWVDDARLVVLNALDAARARRRGPHPHRLHRRPPRGRPVVGRHCRTARPAQRRTVRGAGAGQCRRSLGRTTSSAALPAPNSSRNVRLVKGSHIVVPKFWDGRAGLSPAEQRQAGDLRQPLRGRSGADRHHRHSL